MYTCRTCSLLKYSKRKINQDKEGTAISIVASSILNGIAEWYCPYYWWGHCKPEKGHTCEHWRNFNGKHWL